MLGSTKGGECKMLWTILAVIGVIAVVMWIL